MTERLQKILRDYLGISRRAAEDLIISGKVFLNGKKAEIGMQANRESDTISVDGRPLMLKKQSKTYFAVYKPVGYTCTNKDRFAEKLVTDLVPHGENLFIAGRLDKNSEGLVLLTDDGDLVNKLTHPSQEIEKEYYVLINRSLTNNELARFREGVSFEGFFYRAKSVLLVSNQRNTYKIILTEGKEREIRQILKALGCEVLKLKRVRMASLCLGELKIGKYRKVEGEELNKLLKI